MTETTTSTFVSAMWSCNASDSKAVGILQELIRSYPKTLKLVQQESVDGVYWKNGWTMVGAQHRYAVFCDKSHRGTKDSWEAHDIFVERLKEGEC